MPKTKTIIEVMEDPALFGPVFSSKTWGAWKVLLAALFGLPLTPEQLRLYSVHTGRQSAPIEQFLEAWLICGRRSGKSIISAFIATYLSCFVDWRPYLAPGETATVMLLAGDKKQASVLMGYIVGFLRSIPILSRMIQNQTVDTITLDNRVVIEIHTSSFRAVRGYSIPVALCDEIGFWSDINSSNPASEVLQALRPAQAQFPKPLLLCFSSPYARRGALWEAHRDNFAKDDSPTLVWQAPSRAMNPTISLLTVMRARLRDAAGAKSEWDAEFRSDLESLFSIEVVERLVIPGRFELPPMPGRAYVAFTDPSGGQSDSFTLAIAHMDKDRGVAVLDCIREVIPPFSPDATVREFCDLLKTYRVSEVYGDGYAKDWVSEPFSKQGVKYRPAEMNKSQIYLAFLAAAMSGQVELLSHKKLLNQLTSLERSTRSGGRDSVDHPPGAHDDVSNAVAGVLARIAVGGGVELTFAKIQVEHFNKYGVAWPERGKEDVTVPEVSTPAGPPSENASVVKVRAAQSLGVTCPRCGSSCVVRRQSLYHCNADGFEFPVPDAAGEPPKGQRRENLPQERKWRGR